MTFSIVAREPKTGELGVAVATSIANVGCLVPLIRPGVGAVAVQGRLQSDRRKLTLDRLESGASPTEALTEVLEPNAHASEICAGLIDARGRVAVFMGGRVEGRGNSFTSEGGRTNGHRVGDNFSVQGGVASERVLEAMAETFVSQGKEPFAMRLVLALAAGEAAGAQYAGRSNSAAVIVADRKRIRVDVGVNEHAEPIKELGRRFAIETSADRMIEALFQRHERAVLGLSGGKDSLTLLHLCSDYREQIEVAWVDTGASFPHMRAHIRKAAKGFEYREILTDQKSYIKLHGYPADIVPALNRPEYRMTNGMPGGRSYGVPLQPWGACCSALRTKPLTDYAMTSGATLLLVGQRHSDRAPFPEGILPQVMPYPSLEVAWPLRHWTDSDVYAYVERHEIELPEQYGYGAGSLDCWNCPADRTIEEIAFMEEQYPELLDQLRPRIEIVYDAIVEQFQKTRPWVSPALGLRKSAATENKSERA